MHPIRIPRALRRSTHSESLRLVPAVPRDIAPYSTVARAGELPTTFGPADAARHVERVITPNENCTPDILIGQREKLRRALLTLGSKWIGHPARRITRASAAGKPDAAA